MRFCLVVRAVMMAWVGLRLLLPAIASSDEEIVALYPLRGLGVEDETVANLQSIVYHELDRVPGMRVVELERVREFIQMEEIDCRGKDACLGELARELDAGVVLYGVVGGIGDSYTIALKAVDARTDSIRSRVELRVGGAREVLIDSIRAGAYKLLRPDLYAGSLELDLPVEGAEVYVDGRLVGITPLTEPVAGLEPGQRALKIVKTGFTDFDRFIEVRFQRPSVVSIDLDRSAVSGVIYEEAQPEEEIVRDDSHREEPVEKVAGDIESIEETDDIELSESDVVIAQVAIDDPIETMPSIDMERKAGALRVGAHALLAGGGAALAAGGYFGLSARGQENSLSSKFDRQQGPLLGDIDAWNKAHDTAEVANMLYVAGGAVTLAGIVLLAVDIMRVDDAVRSSSELSLVSERTCLGGGMRIEVLFRW